ncbi:MAG: hypothetical protein IPN49_04540 [Saprospiraceae bacterium]|nr:hypothetical protein [Saprospiraceae bacterium]
MKYPEQKLDPKWITGESKIDNSKLVKWLESFGDFLAKSGDTEAKPITTTQIRKFFW